jgi:hypothetical protein
METKWKVSGEFDFLQRPLHKVYKLVLIKIHGGH